MAHTLVGRGPELAVLRGFLHVVWRRREGRVAVVEGEVGIGKSRLLEGALASEEGAGLRVLRGGADELGRERPFGARRRPPMARIQPRLYRAFASST